MDQPQNDITDSKNDAQNEQPTYDQPNPQEVYSTEPQGEATPITVTSSTQTSTPYEPQVPQISTENSDIQVNDDNGNLMQTETAEASVPPVVDELASVADELQAMEAKQFDESTPMPPQQSSGVDPMEQVLANEAAEAAVEESHQLPVSDVVAAPAIESELAYSSPTVAQDNTMPVADAPSESTIPSSTTDTSFESRAIQETAIPTNPQVISDVIMPTTPVESNDDLSGTNAITGTPESVSASVAAAPVAVSPKPPKSKKGMIVAVVIVITLLFGGAAIATYMMKPADKDTKTSESTEQSTQNQESLDSTLPADEELVTAKPGDDIDAKTLDDFKAVCGGGMVANATAYSGVGPHPIVVFEKGSDDQFAMNVLSFTDKKWEADTTDPSSGRLVACISRIKASEVKLKSCPITDPTTKVTVNVDYYSSDYDVEVFSAKDAKSVAQFEASSTSDLCPTSAIYNKSDPKIYATYDVTTLEKSLKDFVNAEVEEE